MRRLGYWWLVPGVAGLLLALELVLPRGSVASLMGADGSETSAEPASASAADPPQVAGAPEGRSGPLLDGAALVRDLTEVSLWDPENAGRLEALDEVGPDGEPVLRSVLVDGQGSTGQDGIERNDLQGGEVPLGSVRWIEWNERFVELPDTDLDRFQLIGPSEIHGHTLSQATVMPEVTPDKRRRFNLNAGRPDTRYFDAGPIVPGEWSSYRLGIRYTEGDDGWIEVWRDGERVVRVDGPTTTEPYAGYWKFGHYRNAAIDGTSVYDVSGVRIYGG